MIHENYTSLKQTYPDYSSRHNYFLPACSLFFVSSDNLNYDISMKLRPHKELIGVDFLQIFTIVRYFARCVQNYARALPRGSHLLIHVAPELLQQVNSTFECNRFLPFH